MDASIDDNSRGAKHVVQKVFLISPTLPLCGEGVQEYTRPSLLKVDPPPFLSWTSLDHTCPRLVGTSFTERSWYVPLESIQCACGTVEGEATNRVGFGESMVTVVVCGRAVLWGCSL